MWLERGTVRKILFVPADRLGTPYHLDTLLVVYPLTSIELKNDIKGKGDVDYIMIGDQNI
jgi:hypothetical protein